MPKTTNFPNGQSLTSSALSTSEAFAIFQIAFCQALGIPTNDPRNNTAVRLGWQTQGAPAWTIGDDVASLECSLEDAENDYDKIRDYSVASNDAVSVTTTYNYTRKWKLVSVFRGPSAFDNARLIKSAMLLDFLHDMLAASNLYLLPGMPTVVRIPELFEGQWWERCDLSLFFYEGVTETINVSSVASTEVIVNDVNGQQTDFTVSVP